MCSSSRGQGLTVSYVRVLVQALVGGPGVPPTAKILSCPGEPCCHCACIAASGIGLFQLLAQMSGLDIYSAPTISWRFSLSQRPLSNLNLLFVSIGIGTPSTARYWLIAFGSFQAQDSRCVLLDCVARRTSCHEKKKEKKKGQKKICAENGV